MCLYDLYFFTDIRVLKEPYLKLIFGISSREYILWLGYARLLFG